MLEKKRKRRENEKDGGEAHLVGSGYFHSRPRYQVEAGEGRADEGEEGGFVITQKSAVGAKERKIRSLNSMGKGETEALTERVGERVMAAGASECEGRGEGLYAFAEEWGRGEQEWR